MIRSFANKGTEALFNGKPVRVYGNIDRRARRKLEALDAATSVEDLRTPPGNHLEALKGDRKGQYSIKINDQYRLCFSWIDGHAYEVEVCDYH